MSQFVGPMHKPNIPVSLADLSAVGIRLRPYEAVTIVRELLLQVTRGEIAGVPSSHVIRLSAHGSISVEGPVGAGGPSVRRAAQLLDVLLPASPVGSQLRVPGGLRLVLARALGTLDLPPFETLEAFTDALARFASSDPPATVKNLVAAWADFVGSRAPADDLSEVVVAPSAPIQGFASTRPPDLPQSSEVTVSDVRRARRATGLTLAQIGRLSGVQVGLLRQLEWGYLLNWPSGRGGRALLISYARAAGLDEDFVLSAVVPLLREVERRRAELAPTQTVVPPSAAVREPVVDVEVMHVPVAAPDEVRRSRWTNVLAALAIPALLVLALFPAWWASSPRRAEIPTAQHSATQTPQQSGSSSQLSSTPNRSDQVERAAAPDVPARRAEAQPAASPQSPSRHATQPPAVDFNSERLYRLAMTGANDTSIEPIGTAGFYADTGDYQAVSGLMPASGSSREAVLRITRIVDKGSNNLNLRVSPDGRHIAFDSNRDGVRGVYIADRDGTNVRRVSADGFAALPSWSPDSATLAFVRADPPVGDAWNVWTLDLNSGELAQVTRHKAGQPRGASWFPDGKRLAYSHGDRVIVRDLRSRDERTFPSPRRNRPVRAVSVSPDGRRMVLQVDRDGAWLLEFPDGSVRRVLDDATAEEFTWSPDSRRIAYHSRRIGGWGVWVMAPR